MPRRSVLTALASIPLLLTGLLPLPAASAAAPVQIVLDGRTLQLDPPATIVNDRTLIPVRGVFEAMGAKLTWDGETRTVEVMRGERYVRLRIDRRLACLNRACTEAATLDVPARIIQDRTFVPVRFIAQAMGAHVQWDGERRAVLIDTSRRPDYTFAQVTIPTLEQNQVISGPVPLRAEGPEGEYVLFYLIDPATGAGPMIAAGPDPSAAYTYTPDPTMAGTRLIVAAIRQSDGTVHYSDPVTVRIDVDPQVKLEGIRYGQTITGPIEMGSSVNFAATHVTFRLTDPQSGAVEELATLGAGDRFTWYPQIGHNGAKWLQVIAYDRSGNAHSSPAFAIRVESDYRQFFYGIEEGDVLSRPVSIGVRTNYPVESVEYFLDGEHLARGLTHWFSFGPELNGPHTMQVRIAAADGTATVIGPISFTIDTRPSIWLYGIGPDQVVTGPVELKISRNVPLKSIRYYLTDGSGRTEKIGETGPWETFTWTPSDRHAGTRTIYAQAVTEEGAILTSGQVTFRVYTGKIYGPVPIVPKDQFKELASRLAVPAYHRTGMSAALQVAQAILETGWGQHVPRDKYTGQLSNNLFGIKGTGPAGSIVSTTWEVYGGQRYVVDANFRAYHSVAESWADHKELLLTRPWYQPFREVMTDPILGAWALRRSGYATDPAYPLKLIRIMKEHDLFRLDLVEL